MRCSERRGFWPATGPKPRPPAGAPTLDLARATQAQLSALEVTQTVVTQEGRTRRSVTIKTPDRVGAAKALLSRELPARDTLKAEYDDEFLRAARAISAESPPLDPEYMEANAHRLDELDEHSMSLKSGTRS